MLLALEYFLFACPKKKQKKAAENETARSNVVKISGALMR
jgi:hypothetical protein